MLVTQVEAVVRIVMKAAIRKFECSKADRFTRELEAHSASLKWWTWATASMVHVKSMPTIRFA